MVLVLALPQVHGGQVADVGGKGASLGELTRIPGVRVPDGFCVTTAAFARAAVDAGPVPDDVASAICRAVARCGADASYAVRSSATDEDLPGASFAGQHDSYLNVRGPDVLAHVRRCWASLFSDRAVAYRRRAGIDDRGVAMGVVVQRMVDARASGVVFTADPVTSNRRLASVEAVPGLGDALVSGRATPDVYAVRDGALAARTIAGQREHPALTDAQAVALVELARRVEAHFGCPQDIEWCLDDDGRFWIVQARPITTLFPVPETGDGANHVFVSVGHQQMMTDPMKPLGLSFWQLTTPRPMSEAGGRLFVDVTRGLASPQSRTALIDALGRSDPRIGEALQAIVDRGDFLPAPGDGPVRMPPASPPDSFEPDPALVGELIARTEASRAALERDIATLSGAELLAFIRADLQQDLKQVVFDPRGLRVIMAAMDASFRLRERLEEWLGERDAVDTLTQAVARNVTSDMGLALLDVADVVREHPAVVAFLEDAPGERFFDELPALPGGAQARAAIEDFLCAYGMRCPGEIDITRPRWRERPDMLVPMILADVRSFAPGEARRRIEDGRARALAKEAELLARLRALPGGDDKAAEVKRMIDRVRTFIGFREYPKYGMVGRYWVYKQALLAEARRLVAAGVLGDAEDVFFLRFAELEELAAGGRLGDDRIRARRDALRGYEALRPPRVFTSDGEVLSGTERREGLPAGALAGLPVCAGTVEGRARVVLDPARADLEPGDILVTTFTDPSWTPLFLGVAGLVTEVGGVMTHGAVIAREYGLPAVVGVEDATRAIPDGRRIRVNGTDGYVELLP